MHIYRIGIRYIDNDIVELASFEIIIHECKIDEVEVRSVRRRP